MSKPEYFYIDCSNAIWVNECVLRLMSMGYDILLPKIGSAAWLQSNVLSDRTVLCVMGDLSVSAHVKGDCSYEGITVYEYMGNWYDWLRGSMLYIVSGYERRGMRGRIGVGAYDATVKMLGELRDMVDTG